MAVGSGKQALGWTEQVLRIRDRTKGGVTALPDGLYFVGIDVIGGKLVEVNVMSPGGITYINKVYKLKAKIEEKVIDFLEMKVLDKLQAFDRRARLRREVEDA